MKLLALLFALFGSQQSFVASDVQVDALYEWKMQLTDNQGVLKDWKDNQMSPCYWQNVICQGSNAVSVTLSSSGLSGVLGPSIANLTSLQQLILDDNNITGEIPREFGNLSSLTILELKRNILNGFIPGSIGYLSNLQSLSLAWNYISGEIPQGFENLSSLVILNLGRNYLSGAVPEFLGNLQKLQILDLSENRLSGSIPINLSDLQSLSYINLSYNDLAGEIPVQLLQVAQYDFTGNNLNCGQHSIPCRKGVNKAGRKIKRWIIATAISVVAAIICSILCFGWIIRHKKDSFKNRLKVNEHRVEEEWGMDRRNSEFTIFNFSQVFEATKHFSEETKLGQGGFGPVYKGKFTDGLEIAVKRLASHSGQDETRRSLLSWNKCLMIIEGIAQGLLYLHKHSRLRVIHRDIKASNILLDSEMNPKISDFGLARMFSSDDTDGNTNRVVGTYGYMAPEYASEGLFSTKSDVFSFGVLMLEIVSGKRNSRFHQYGDFLNLLGYAWQQWREGRWLELVDASLLVSDSHRASDMMRCIIIALLCVQEAAPDRPTMSDVIAMLHSESMILSEPKHPAYFHVMAPKEETSAATGACSANDVTISSLQGR